MGKRRGSSGQSLVEAALALPGLCLGIFLGVQLVIYCHDAIELHRMAQLSTDINRKGLGTQIRNYYLFHGLWGHVILPQMRTTVQRAAPWRRHRGISTIRTPGSFVQTNVAARLLPGPGFSRVFPPALLQSAAQTYFEPSIEQES